MKTKEQSEFIESNNLHTGYWISFAFIVVVLFFIVYTTVLSSRKSLHQKQIFDIAIEQEDVIRQIEDDMHSMYLEEDSAKIEGIKLEIFKKLENFESRHRRLSTIDSLDFFDPKSKNEYLIIVDMFGTPVSDIIAISHLLLSSNQMTSDIDENNDILMKQFNNAVLSYSTTLHQLESWTLDGKQDNNEWLTIFFVIAALIIIAIYLIIFNTLYRPSLHAKEIIAKKFNLLQQRYQSDTKELQLNSEKLVEQSILIETQRADIIKLKDSLNVSISNISFQQQIKEKIYIQAASEIKAPLKILKKQIKTLQSSPDNALNSRLLTIKSSVNKLNDLVGRFYYLARHDDQLENNENLYLSQLLSEIIVEIKEDEMERFKIIGDLPVIHTNVEQLHLVLKSFMQVLQDTALTLVEIKSEKRGKFCEFTFSNIGGRFENMLNKTKQAHPGEVHEDLSDLVYAQMVLKNYGGRLVLESSVNDRKNLVLTWPL